MSEFNNNEQADKKTNRQKIALANVQATKRTQPPTMKSKRQMSVFCLQPLKGKQLKFFQKLMS